MLVNLSETFHLVLPLFFPPTKPFVTEFTAESFAFLIRKCGEVNDVLAFFNEVASKGEEYYECTSMLLFHTVSGVKNSFNSSCEDYVQVVLSHCKSSNSLMEPFKGMLNVVVTKISKEESNKVWNILVSQLSLSDKQTFTSFLLSCVKILLKGGKFTYLIDPEVVSTTLTKLMTDNQDEEDEYVEFLKCFITAYLQLLRYRKQDTPIYDENVIKSYLSCHRSTVLLENFVNWLMDQEPFFERYYGIIFEELSVLGIATPYLEILCNISVKNELRDVLFPPKIFNFSSKHRLLKQLLMKPKLPNDTVLFSLLKILQCASVESDDITKLVSQLLQDYVSDESPFHIQIEAIKTRLVIGDLRSLPGLPWFLNKLENHHTHPLLLQCLYLFLKEESKLLTLDTHDMVISLLKVKI